MTLILVLLGLYQGWNLQMTKFLGNIPVDYWVGQKGSRDVSHSVSILSSDLKSKISQVDGISEVNTFVGKQVSFKKNNQEVRIFLVGLEKYGVTKPFKIESGNEFPNKNEIILDQTIARREDIKIGDKLSINSEELTVSGISSGGNLMIYSYAFVNMEDAKKIIDFKSFVNYYLIKSDNMDLTKENLEKAFPNLEIMSKQQFLDNNTEIITDTFLPIIEVLLIIAVVIGIAVIGLTIYTATIEKSQEYGVLKAIGYSNLQLFSIALIQSLVAGIIGLIAGSILTILVVNLATYVTSAFIFELGFPEMMAVISMALGMSIVAAFIPLRRLLSIDPANVFKV